MKVFPVLSAMAVSLGTFVVACSSTTSSSSSSSSWSCSATGKCSSDGPPAESDVASCDMALADPCCGPYYRAMQECMFNHEQCAADGSQDVQATVNQCLPENQSFANCLQQNCVGDGGTG